MVSFDRILLHLSSQVCTIFSRFAGLYKPYKVINIRPFFPSLSYLLASLCLGHNLALNPPCAEQKGRRTKVVYANYHCNMKTGKPLRQLLWMLSFISASSTVQDPATSSGVSNENATDTSVEKTAKTAGASQTISSYVYDAASGYYYDTTTGLYYDPTTQV